MGIRLVTFYNSTVTPQDDALIYENALPASGMIYGGNVTIKNANTLHITAGHGALCGRKFTIEEDDIPIILTSSGTLNGRLYVHMDLSDTGEPISLEVERANVLTPVVQQSNVNINDGIYEINLATFTISTSTVSDLNYVAPFIKDLDAREVIIAPVEPTNIASSNYAVGKHLILDKVLYVVTTTITAGQTITPGSNVAVSDTVEKQIEDINTALGTKVNTADIANNLTTTAAGKVLDARQGKALNDVLVPKANQAVIAPRQANATAARTYYAGDQFILDNVLYTATKTINSGTAINSGNSTASATIVSQISNLEKAIDISANLSAYDVYAQNVAITGISAYKCGKVILLSIDMSLYQGFSHNTSIFKIKTFPAKLKAPINWIAPIWSISLGKVIGFMRLAYGTDYINFYTAGASIAGDQYNNISAVIFCGQD